MQTNQTQPFTYIVGWTTHNIYYVGVRYAKGCSPEDLGTTYFTSSKVIKPLWAKEEPDFKCIYPFETREEALAFEETLQREFNVLKSKQFANKAIRGKYFRSYGSHTEQTKKKIGDANRGKERTAEQKLNMSQYIREVWSSSELRKKRGERSKELWEDEGYVLKQKTSRKISANRESTRQKFQETISSPVVKAQMRARSKECQNRPEVREKKRKAALINALNPDIRQKNIDSHTSKLLTPDGIFESTKKAAEYYKVSATTMQARIRAKPDLYKRLPKK